MKFLLLSVLLTFSVMVQARVVGLKNIQGEWGSGGGNALVCFQNVIIAAGEKQTTPAEIVKKNNYIIPDTMLQYIDSIEMFDLYDAKKRRGLNQKKPEIITIKDDEGYYEYIDRIAKRFVNYVDGMDWLISDAKMLLPDSNIIFHEAGIVQHNDLGNITLPGTNCLISTMAAQVSINTHFELYIDERLFNHPKHSKQSQATLILHELIYAYGRAFRDHKDSTATRKLVRQYISYHSSVTEGSTSILMHNLNFNLSEPEYKLKAALKGSKVMNTFEWEMTHFYYMLRQNYDYTIYLLFDAEGSQFYNLVSSELKKIYNDEVFAGTDGYRKLVAMIEKGAEVSEHQQWKDFKSKLSLIRESQSTYVLNQVHSAKEYVLNNIKEGTHITPTQLSLLNKFLDGWVYEITTFMEFTSDEERENFFFHKMAEDSLLLIKKIYDINTTTVCRSGPVSTEPIPVPTDPTEKMDNCYGPLVLDHMIPKEFKPLAQAN